MMAKRKLRMDGRQSDLRAVDWDQQLDGPEIRAL